jgi:pimeloyl-ACP methyl ester carboxylesterase
MTHALNTPDWLDWTAYPFEPRFFETPHGRIHYVDEGSGPPVVLVHGTPTWSFLWRHPIRELSRTHRVVAPDHLGFGLSDKPREAPYRPEDHASRLSALIDHLDLRDVALVVHDFGGPIGLAHAVESPDNVRALVLFNTWMWSKAGDANTVRASRILGGGLGRFLYTRFNLSPRVLLPAVYADRQKLTPEIHRHYLWPFPDAASRTAPWVLARELVGSSDWYESLWERRGRLAGKPALILWGEKDPAFGEADLDRWRLALPDAEVRTFPGAGHFLQEEEPEAAARAVAAFLGG